MSRNDVSKTVFGPVADESRTVSIVIPTCNRAAHLQRCLDALATQRHEDFEILVVDDGSNDDTPTVVERFAASHPELPITLLRHDETRGANPSRNLGWRTARGPLIAFLDGDCIAEPDWLRHLLAPFEDVAVGAATGLVNDPPPTNLFEMSFHGTHRVAGPGRARRLVAGNMCVRRSILERLGLDEDRAGPRRNSDGTVDTSVSARGDEEGLFQLLKAAGWQIRAASEAVVLHDDHMSAKRFFRQAFLGGKSAARLVYKYRLGQRKDMLPFIVGWLLVALTWLHLLLGAAGVLCLCAGLAAIIYNDIHLKGKSATQTFMTLPLQVVYYHLRLVGYILESARLRLTRHDLQRISRDVFRDLPKEAGPSIPS